jgi:DNA-binding response OmpR family regulator
MDRKILIVDDEVDIREILQFNLENAGFNVECASSAEEALEKLTPDFALILLDVMMHGMSGFQMAQLLRNERDDHTPIIFLTAKDTQEDLLTGFSSGADDYIPKPFSIQEVIVRVKAVLRRYPQAEPAPEPVQETVVVAGALRIDLEKKIVHAGDQLIAFSKKEFEVLSLLASHPGQIFSREDLINELWKDAPYVLDRTVDVHIARIRSKLGEYKNCISNRSGFGYVFNAVEK